MRLLLPECTGSRLEMRVSDCADESMACGYTNSHSVLCRQCYEDEGQLIVTAKCRGESNMYPETQVVAPVKPEPPPENNYVSDPNDVRTCNDGTTHIVPIPELVEQRRRLRTRTKDQVRASFLLSESWC